MFPKSQRPSYRLAKVKSVVYDLEVNPTDSEKLTVSLLKEKTGITDQHLNQKVEQNLLKKLAGFFDSWEKYVESPGLNLKMGEIVDIRECAPKYGNEMAVYKALKLWQIRNP